MNATKAIVSAVDICITPSEKGLTATVSLAAPDFNITYWHHKFNHIFTLFYKISTY